MSNPRPFVLQSDENRFCPMSGMSAYFIANGGETDSNLSVAEWWLEPGTVSPNVPEPLSQPEEHLVYVIHGVVSVQLNGD